MPGSVTALIVVGVASAAVLLCLCYRFAVREVPDSEVSDCERELQTEIRQLEALEMELAIAEELGQDPAMLTDLAALVDERRERVDTLAAAVAGQQH